MGEAPAEAGAAALPGAQETGPAWHTPVTALVDRVDEQDLRAAEGVLALMDSWEPGKTQVPGVRVQPGKSTQAAAVSMPGPSAVLQCCCWQVLSHVVGSMPLLHAVAPQSGIADSTAERDARTPVVRYCRLDVPHAPAAVAVQVPRT